jgi:hypothetical protein
LVQPKRFILIFIVFILLSACSSSGNIATNSAEIFPTTSSDHFDSDIEQGDSFSDLPKEARKASRFGDPRMSGYWAKWNSCAQDNRATQAAAHGGRASGWILMDDLISNPGIQIGDFQVKTCEVGLAILSRQTIDDKDYNELVYELAKQLLTAELNLNTGAETCPISEEAVIGAHLVLSNAVFNGTGEYSVLSEEIASAIPRLVELLKGYNAGDLCN